MANSSQFKLDRVEIAAATALLREAGNDTDRASFVVFGESLKAATGCVVVLKGREETVWLRDMLIRQKLLTPGKSISPAMEKLPEA